METGGALCGHSNAPAEYAMREVEEEHSSRTLIRISYAVLNGFLFSLSLLSKLRAVRLVVSHWALCVAPCRVNLPHNPPATT